MGIGIARISIYQPAPSAAHYLNTHDGQHPLQRSFLLLGSQRPQIPGTTHPHRDRAPVLSLVELAGLIAVPLLAPLRIAIAAPSPIIGQYTPSSGNGKGTCLSVYCPLSAQAFYYSLSPSRALFPQTVRTLTSSTSNISSLSQRTVSHRPRQRNETSPVFCCQRYHILRTYSG